MNLINLFLISTAVSMTSLGVVHFTSGADEQQRTKVEHTDSQKQGQTTMKPQMLLIGGGLKVCSSFSQKNCANKLDQEQLIKRNLRTNNNVRISRDLIQYLKSSGSKVFSDKEKLKQVINTYKHYINKYDEGVVGKDDFEKRINRLDKLSISYKDFLKNLSNKEYHFLKQSTQAPVEYTDGKVYREAVFLDNSNQYSIEIVERAKTISSSIAKTKGKSKPLILVMTSSSNDPFDAVDFYLNLFSQGSVKSAWLPLEPALLDVLSSDELSCSDLEQVRESKYAQFRRSQVYPILSNYQMALCKRPEMLDELIKQADALFINGGDQSLTLKALVHDDGPERRTTPFLQRIRERYLEGKLAVMGTSAGTAIQSGGDVAGKLIPMISNGISIAGGFSGSTAVLTPPSENCNDESCPKGLVNSSLTHNPNGGLGLNPIGVFDTHFSERNRIIRLTRLLFDTEISKGIGIDENTALHIVTANEGFQQEVIGEGYAWFIDVSDADIETELSKKPHQVSKVLMKNIDVEVLMTAEGGLETSQDVLGFALQGLNCKPKNKFSCQATVEQQNLPLVLEASIANFESGGRRVQFELTAELSLSR